MRKIGGVRLFSVLLLMTLGASTPAIAEDETFHITSMADKDVQIEFFSEDRHSAWPGNGMAYKLNDYKEHNFKLACINREKICYGAWITNNPNVYWGAGPHGSAGCSDCCVECRGGQVREIILRDPIHR
jgi:hypothetical protein